MEHIKNIKDTYNKLLEDRNKAKSAIWNISILWTIKSVW